MSDTMFVGYPHMADFPLAAPCELEVGDTVATSKHTAGELVDVEWVKRNTLRLTIETDGQRYSFTKVANTRTVALISAHTD